MVYDANDPLHLLNRPNKNGFTPMYLAAKNGLNSVIELLLDRRANPNLGYEVRNMMKNCENKNKREQI